MYYESIVIEQHGCMEKRLLRFRCGQCGCVFLLNPKEAFFDTEEKGYIADCPECGAPSATKETIAYKEAGF